MAKSIGESLRAAPVYLLDTLRGIGTKHSRCPSCCRWQYRYLLPVACCLLPVACLLLLPVTRARYRERRNLRDQCQVPPHSTDPVRVFASTAPGLVHRGGESSRVSACEEAEIGALCSRGDLSTLEAISGCVRQAGSL